MEELYELPEGWVWTTLPAMSDISIYIPSPN
jgi:hypothetical protein